MYTRNIIKCTPAQVKTGKRTCNAIEQNVIVLLVSDSNLLVSIYFKQKGGYLDFSNLTKLNKHSESIAWQYQVPCQLHIFLEV